MSKIKSSKMQTATRQNMPKIQQKVWGLPAQTAIRAGEAIYLDCPKDNSSKNGQT
jgi:hypothetical protein